MESISIVKGATTVKKEAEKVQRQKSFFLHKYHMLLFSAMVHLGQKVVYEIYCFRRFQ